MLLAFAYFKIFIFFQMDIKSTFLDDFINEEVYVEKSLGFENPHFLNLIFKLSKSLYSLY